MDYLVHSLIAAATIRGLRLFHSTCPLVWPLFKGGVYSRVCLFEEIQYILQVNLQRHIKQMADTNGRSSLDCVVCLVDVHG